jgi:hypothetical protein
MAFVAYLVSIVAAFVGVLALYGTLLKPMTAKRPPPAQAVAADKAEPETTSSTRAHAKSPRKQDEALAARRKREALRTRERDEAHQARAQEEADAEPAPARASPATSRRSPVRSEPDEGLRLKPERCWIVTDKTRNFGYYGPCQ